MSYKGKMAVPVGDGDNLLGWDKATIKLISQKNNTRTYEFSVPALDGSVTAKRKITFVKEDNKWKIISSMLPSKRKKLMSKNGH
jgi:hypothetical protein